MPDCNVWLSCEARIINRPCKFCGYAGYLSLIHILTSRQGRNDDNTVIKEAHTYTYGDSEWKDLLTAFDGKSITYDDRNLITILSLFRLSYLFFLIHGL